MHFFSFKMADDVRRAYLEAGHELLLFGRTRESAADGTALCVIIGSSDCFQQLVACAVQHARTDKDRRIAHYFIHGTEDVEKGLALGAQELKAEDN